MLTRLLQLLHLACAHRNTSQPFTASGPPPRSAASSNWEPVGSAQHYVVCLDCGKEFVYDWQNMRIMKKGS